MENIFIKEFCQLGISKVSHYQNTFGGAKLHKNLQVIIYNWSKMLFDDGIYHFFC